jgi:hypothetical protein
MVASVRTEASRGAIEEAASGYIEPGRLRSKAEEKA